MCRLRAVDLLGSPEKATGTMIGIATGSVASKARQAHRRSRPNLAAALEANATVARYRAIGTD